MSLYNMPHEEFTYFDPSSPTHLTASTRLPAVNHLDLNIQTIPGLPSDPRMAAVIFCTSEAAN